MHEIQEINMQSHNMSKFSMHYWPTKATKPVMLEIPTASIWPTMQCQNVEVMLIEKCLSRRDTSFSNVHELKLCEFTMHNCGRMS